MDPVKLQQFLDAIARRSPLDFGGAVSLAQHYVRGFEQCAGQKQLRKYFKLGSDKEWQQALKDTATLLCFSNGDMGEFATSHKNDAGQIIHSGSPTRKDMDEMTPKSIMDFECIVSSKRRDRGKDVLNPLGCEIDEKSPLLWQHIPMEPVGKYVKTLAKTAEIVKAHCCIAGTPLGYDAALLVDFGALRISHGFRPKEFQPLDEIAEYKDEPESDEGWFINSYSVMEISLVSIPSNVDAVITAHSQSKLHHPLVKSWAARISDGRPAVVKGNWSPPSASAPVNITINNGMPTKSAKEETPPNQDDNPGATGEENPNANPDDQGKEEGEGAAVISEIHDMVVECGKMEGMPEEAVNRLNTLAGLLSDVQTSITNTVEAIQEHAGNENLGGVLEAVDGIGDAITGGLGRVASELESIISVPDMPDAGREACMAIRERVHAVLASLAGGASGDEAGESGEGQAGEPSDSEPPPMSESQAQASATKLCGYLMGGGTLDSDTLEMLESCIEQAHDDVIKLAMAS